MRTTIFSNLVKRSQKVTPSELPLVASESLSLSSQMSANHKFPIRVPRSQHPPRSRQVLLLLLRHDAPVCRFISARVVQKLIQSLPFPLTTSRSNFCPVRGRREEPEARITSVKKAASRPTGRETFFKKYIIQIEKEQPRRGGGKKYYLLYI